MIPYPTFTDEFAKTRQSQSSPTRDQKARWLSLLDESKSKFETALERTKEAAQIKPEIASKSTEDNLRNLIDVTARLRDTVARLLVQ